MMQLHSWFKTENCSQQCSLPHAHHLLQTFHVDADMATGLPDQPRDHAHKHNSSSWLQSPKSTGLTQKEWCEGQLGRSGALFVGSGLVSAHQNKPLGRD